jgi:nitrite reductase (NO-forming)
LSAAGAASSSESARRCRRPPRTLAPGALRPSDMLAAFFLPGIGFLLAAAVVGAIDATASWAPAHWLALHLAFVGGVSQLVLGAGQFFAGAFLATDPPSKRLIAVQLATWNAGAILVAVGVPSSLDAVVIAGAALLVVGLGAFLAGLRGLTRRSIQRMPWAVRWYEACAVFLGVGVLIGVALATGATWSAGNLLGAHIALNLGGWFGTAIVGTLHTFFPSITQTRLRHPALQRPTFAAWTLGVTALAAGFAFDAGPLVVAGWAALLVAAALLCANLAGSLRAATGRALSLPARLIAPAQACLVAALLVALVTALDGSATAGPVGDARAAVAILLVPGWLGLTVAGALLHLLAVLIRVRDLRTPLPAPRPLRDRALVGALLLGVAVVAAARGFPADALQTPAAARLVAAYAILGSLVAARAGRAALGLRSRRGAPRGPSATRPSASAQPR